MLVYRIELKDGRDGPWRNSLSRDFHDEFNANYSQYASAQSHPIPREDGIHNFNNEVHRCGCETIGQLKYWFGKKSLPELFQRWGFVVRAYKIAEDKAIIGRHQVAFEFEHATLEAEYEVTEKLP